MTDSYDDEMVTRAAPRWAWYIIDDTLACDASSSAFDPALRKQVSQALTAMVLTCSPGINDELLAVLETIIIETKEDGSIFKLDSQIGRLAQEAIRKARATEEE